MYNHNFTISCDDLMTKLQQSYDEYVTILWSSYDFSKIRFTWRRDDMPNHGQSIGNRKINCRNDWFGDIFKNYSVNIC